MEAGASAGDVCASTAGVLATVMAIKVAWSGVHRTWALLDRPARRPYCRAMPRVRLTVVAVFLALLSGCDPGTFYTEVKGETTIQGSALYALLGDFQPIGSFTNIDFNSNQDFQNEGITKDQVTSVRVESFTLRILSPSTGDFDFLDEIHFFAKVGSDEEELAGATNITARDLSAPNPVLQLDVRGVELQPFVTADTMSIVTRGSGRMPSSDTRLEARVRLKIQFELVDLNRPQN